MENPIDQVRKRTEALKKARAKGISEVGIFWFFRGEIYSSMIPYTLGDDYGDFVNGKSDHCTYWRSIQRLSRDAANYEYDQVPRGRVVYSKKDDTFFVYGSEEFIRNERQKSEILLEFKLPPEKAVFRADEHYGRISGMLEEEFAGS